MSITTAAPHLTPRTSVRTVMLKVLLALLPAAVLHSYHFGPGLLINASIASLTALAVEAAMLSLRGRAPGPALADLSAVVAAVLLAFCLPPLTPWWVTVLGTAFALVFAKHLYGGLGQNPFNPAMVGYVFLLISFPLELTRWLAPRAIAAPPDLADSLAAILGGSAPDAWDALTQATPLDHARDGLSQALTLPEITVDPRYGELAGAGWEQVAVALLLGGVLLLALRVIRWHTPLAVLASLGALAALGHHAAPDLAHPASFHLLGGATMIGAFFIATDPVTGPASVRGRVIYGVGIGVITYCIRRWGGYPDGIAFAVLLMNMAVPVIDRYTVPRAYGHGDRSIPAGRG